MEGRCFRCLAGDHRAQTCREPIRCRLCRQAGHRQYACPQNKRNDARPMPLERTPSGLYACLVGEIIDADPTWMQILECVQEISPSLTHPVCHRLVSGQIILQDLSRDVENDAGVDVPSPRRRLHPMATATRHRWGISSCKGDSSSALGGDARTHGDATDDPV